MFRRANIDTATTCTAFGVNVQQAEKIMRCFTYVSRQGRDGGWELAQRSESIHWPETQLQKCTKEFLGANCKKNKNLFSSSLALRSVRDTRQRHKGSKPCNVVCPSRSSANANVSHPRDTMITHSRYYVQSQLPASRLRQRRRGHLPGICLQNKQIFIGTLLSSFL